MARAGLDALLVVDEANLAYLAGYEGWSDYVPQAALVTLNDDPYLILREMDVRHTPAAVWLPKDRVIGYGEGNVGTAERSGWESIGEFVKGKVPASARIGVEFSVSHRGRQLGVTEHAKLVAALGGRELRDGSGLVSKCKRVKSERELLYMSEAAAIADRAMLLGIDKIAVGTRQCDVAATITSALISGTVTIPGGPNNRTLFMQVGKIANAPHTKWTDEAYKAGQQTNFEFAGVRHRYHSALARTVYLGSTPPRLKEVSKGVIEAWHAIFEKIQPGVRCSDVARVGSAVLKRYGIKKESRFAYSIGVEWLDGGGSCATNDDSEIVPNMTFHHLIGIFEPDEGYMFSETIRVTEAGAKSLSNSVPRKLFEIHA
jgi:Xaa-Pro aminopeptidase